MGLSCKRKLVTVIFVIQLIAIAAVAGRYITLTAGALVLFAASIVVYAFHVRFFTKTPDTICPHAKTENDKRNICSSNCVRTNDVVNLVIESIPVPVFHKNAQGKYTGCNGPFCRLLRTTKEQIIGRSVYDIAPKDVAQRYNEADRKLMRDGGRQEYEERIVFPHGEILEVIFHKAVLYDENDKPDGIIGCIVDITEKKEHARRLVNQSSWLNIILGSIGDAVLSTDENGYITYMNLVAENLTGWNLDEAEGLSVEKVMPLTCADNECLVVNPAYEVIEKRVQVDMPKKTVLTRKDGRRVAVDDSASPLVAPDGTFYGCVIIFRDITKKVEAEDLARLNEERFSGIFEHATDPVFLFSSDRKLILANDSACKMLMFNQQEIAESSLDVLLKDECSHDIEESWEEVTRGNAVVREWELVNKSGLDIPVEISLKKLSDDTVMAIARDITARKKLQAQLEYELGDMEKRVSVRTRELAALNMSLKEEIRVRKISEKALTVRLRYEKGLVDCSRSLLSSNSDDSALNNALYSLLQASSTFAVRLIQAKLDSSKNGYSCQIVDQVCVEEDSQEEGKCLDLPPDYSKVYDKWHNKLEIGGHIKIASYHFGESEKEIFSALEISFVLAIPISAGGVLYGFLAFEDKRVTHDMDEQNIRILRTAAAMIGGFLEKSHNEASMRIQSSAIASASDKIMITDKTGEIVFVNPAFEGETGYTTAEIIGKSPNVLKSGKHSQEFYRELWETIKEGRTWRGEITNILRDGRLAIDDTTITPVTDTTGAVQNYVSIGRDVTEKKSYQERLNHLAHHDILTGLANRLLFTEVLSSKLMEAKKNGGSIAVLYMDFDRFKLVNDSLGHDSGDELLKEIARRLQSVARENDLVSRMGGDEFVMVLAGDVNVPVAVDLAMKVQHNIEKPYELPQRQLFLQASIGVAVFPENGRDVETLVKNADAAMYSAKQDAENKVRLYSEAMNTQSLERINLEHDMRRGLEEGQFELYYQPRVDVETGNVAALEALIRWNHPEAGLLSPDRFISIAEETGLVVPLGNWVIEEACRQARAWTESDFGPVPIAVNLSARQFARSDIHATVAKALEDAKLDSQFFEIEITESVLMQDPDAAASSLQSLRDIGVSISLDDFGTGYSSLGYLKRFPIDIVKIDRLFVRDITTNADDAAICGAIIAMSHSLSLKVVAEGVETIEQVAFLDSLHCNEIQGYFISPPLPATRMAEFLTERNRFMHPRKKAA